nr:hypothetical protein BaRGS_006351 [Batillaria attramentaria]
MPKELGENSDNTKDSQTVTVDDMRLAHGAVTSSTINNLFPSTGDYNSVAIRYDTAPQYRSNKILSSFHEEFQHFA